MTKPLVCLGHLLIDCILGGIVVIVHGNREAVVADNRDGVRHAAYLDGY